MPCAKPSMRKPSRKWPRCLAQAAIDYFTGSVNITSRCTTTSLIRNTLTRGASVSSNGSTTTCAARAIPTRARSLPERDWLLFKSALRRGRRESEERFKHPRRKASTSDKTRALEVYAQQARNREAEDKARKIRNRAQRRMGELLMELPRTTPEERAERANETLSRRSSNDRTNVSELSERSGNDGRNVHHQSPYAAALEANGICERTARRYQKLAAIPEKDFEEALRNPAQKPTTAKLIREAYRASEVYESENVDEFARWLWGRALEFERKGYPSKSPANLFVALLPEMQDDMRRLVPVLTDFYQQFSEVIR